MPILSITLQSLQIHRLLHSLLYISGLFFNAECTLNYDSIQGSTKKYAADWGDYRQFSLSDT
jgi:hypothetical protein